MATHHHRLPTAALALLLLVACGPLRSHGEQQDCHGLLREFLEFNQHEAVPYDGDNMVYFLHIPRQGRVWGVGMGIRGGTAAVRAL